MTALGYRPWDIDRLTMRQILDLCADYHWAQEQPGSVAWLLAHLLTAMGSPVPWTARTLLGKPEHHG